MKLPRRTFLHLAAAAAALLFLVTLADQGALSQAARTIKIVVPYPPAGGSDILARVLAEQIGRAQGLTLVVENRPGGGGVIGTEAVSRAAPDGNTLLINTASIVIGPHVRKLNYDPRTSFEPICYLVKTPLLIVVNSASSYRTLADLLKAARAKPGELTLASVGPATTLHVASEKLKRAADAKMIYVPYSGTGPATTALLGEHVTAMIAEHPAVAEQLKSGKLRALATGSSTRIESLPDVPTVAESGYTGYEIDVWWGLFAPANTPKETILQLAGWISAALKAPEMKPKFAIQGLHPVGVCGADFGSFLRNQYDDYGRVIREANIKGE
jgi:tripartite-type tricarboxylate transporter receptor subunit TctC